MFPVPSPVTILSYNYSLQNALSVHRHFWSVCEARQESSCRQEWSWIWNQLQWWWYSLWSQSRRKMWKLLKQDSDFLLFQVTISEGIVCKTQEQAWLASTRVTDENLRLLWIIGHSSSKCQPNCPCTIRHPIFKASQSDDNKHFTAHILREWPAWIDDRSHASSCHAHIESQRWGAASVIVFDKNTRLCWPFAVSKHHKTPIPCPAMIVVQDLWRVAQVTCWTKSSRRKELNKSVSLFKTSLEKNLK